jgi:hypothetical protein
MQFEEMIPEYIMEQIEWRKTKAPNCLSLGYCTYCGCDTPALFYEDRGCKDPDKQCYPKIMSKKEWENFKNNNYEYRKD